MSNSTGLEGSSAFVSDISYNQIERLFSPGRQSLAALIDLAGFAQAAILNEELIVTPGAYENSHALPDLDFVQPVPYEVTVREADEEAAPELEDSDEKEKILIDLNDDGYLTSSHPVGELMLAMMHNIRLRGDLLFGALANPGGFENEEYPLEKAIAHFPRLMMALQVDRGLVSYESEEAQRELEEHLSDSIHSYNSYAVSMNALHQRWGMDTVLSVLEQPFAGTRILDHSLEFAESPVTTPRLRQLLGEVAMNVPGRSKFFEHWNVPPLGVIALAEAKSMDDVPRVIRKSRRKFAKLRESIGKLRSNRAALVERADLSSGTGERALRELASFDSEMRAALDTVSNDLNIRRSPIHRTELVFSTLDFALELMGGLGTGTIGKVVEALGLKQRAVMQRIPGLFRAANLVQAGEEVLASDVIERLIGRAPDELKGQRFILERGLSDSRRYSYSSPSRPPDEEIIFIRPVEGAGDSLEISDRDFWRFSCTRDEFLNFFSFP